MGRSNEEVVRAYAEAHRTHDYAAVGALRHPEWVEDVPQTGERIRGHANDLEIMNHWPGGYPDAGGLRLTGSEDRWVATPSNTLHRIVGSGDTWWADGTASYPDGSTWFCAALITLRDGLVHRETWFFAPPLEAPEWRAPWVERIG
jgi:hypothetical protein